MDLRRLKLFLAVADRGGFTAAAQAEHIAQPAVSLAIRELETELGAALFVRNRGGARLTPAGEALIGPARQALRDIDLAVSAVAAVTGLVTGRLDIAALASLAADPLAEIVGRFRHAHPAVTVHLVHPSDPNGLVGVVRTGVAEIGITERGNAPGLLTLPLADQEMFAIGPPGGTDTPLTRRALAALDLVVTAPGTSLRRIVDDTLGPHAATARIAVETEQRDALVPLVLAGAGTAVVPEALARMARALGATVRQLRPPLRRQLALVHRPDRLSPAAHELIRLAVDPTPRPPTGNPQPARRHPVS